MKPHELQRIRHDARLTQSELAALLGITATQISRLENGRQKISKSMAIAILAVTEYEEPNYA
jgi:transcriptional regulator with XRE-family HTH domain